MMITFGSLFAGIGGLDLGLERAGMICKWQVEIDPFCRKVLQKHWPNVPKYEDVRNVGKHNLEPVDLICGGFPCQPHSLAGKRKGAEDDRNLWPEYRRIIGELQPAWVIGENVPGIRTTILDDILSDLENMDYQTRTLVIPACAFGAPHIRARVFVLAHSSIARSWRLPVFEGGSRQENAYPDRGGESVANSSSTGWNTRGGQSNQYNQAQGGNGKRKFTRSDTGIYPDTSNPGGKGLAQRERTAGERTHAATPGSNWWEVEPGVGRVANGIPNRVDRLRALGNAVVPQVAEWIGRRIVEVDT
jgi:DNA (cytosine-5)-methyltransferase 1